MGFHHALSGLNAASKSLDVSGHNIANSNTVGFKKSRAEFNEMVAGAMGTGQCPGSVGSGIGVSVAAVTQQFSQGVITPTANGLDMAINGDGFFVVNTPKGTAYTRNGAFQLDKSGQLVTANGDKVMGYALDPLTGTRASATAEPITFPSGSAIPANPTTKAEIRLNLDARAPLAAGDPDATPPVPATPRQTYGTSLQAFDSLGVAHPVSVYFEKTGPNTWAVFDGLNTVDADGEVVEAVNLGTLTFREDGTLNLEESTLDPISLELGNGAATPLQVDIDLSKATQFGSAFAVAKITQDGYASGELTGVSVSGDGTLMASYSNGITRPEAQVALARFTNPQGLASAGNNNWVATADAGPAIEGTAGSGSFGTIQGCALEESNVDLTAELVGMMTAQRAYQANAQTIKTQDQVFSTLANLR
jgi:flagellar hook protein FlgE